MSKNESIDETANFLRINKLLPRREKSKLTNRIFYLLFVYKKDVT